MFLRFNSLEDGSVIVIPHVLCFDVLPNGYHVVSRSQCILNGTYEEFYSYRQHSLLGACEEDFEEDD